MHGAGPSSGGPGGGGAAAAVTGTSALAAATRKQSIPSLTPSLRNYYRERLVDHVQGWPSDNVEKQVRFCCRDKMTQLIRFARSCEPCALQFRKSREVFRLQLGH